MTESDKKLLTEYLRECPNHDWIPVSFSDDHWQCKACKLIAQRPLPIAKHRTYTTWADYGAIVEEIQRRGEWEGFESFAHSRWNLHPMPMIMSFTAWLLNPARIEDVVLPWLRQRKG